MKIERFNGREWEIKDYSLTDNGFEKFMDEIVYDEVPFRYLHHTDVREWIIFLDEKSTSFDYSNYYRLETGDFDIVYNNILIYDDMHLYSLDGLVRLTASRLEKYKEFLNKVRSN